MKYRIDDIIKVVVFHDLKHIKKVGMDHQRMQLIEQALKNGNWKIV